MSSFLFDETFRLGDTKVRLVRPELRRPFRFTVTSEQMIHYAIHFIGRAFICPGEEVCPACGTVNKRSLSMLCGGSDQDIAVLELAAPTLACIDAEVRKNDLKGLLGTRWEFCRLIAKRPLSVNFAGMMSPDCFTQLSSALVLRAFAKLFSLPNPDKFSDHRSYAASIEPVLVLKLKAALLGSSFS